MTEILLLPGEPPVEVTLKRSKRSRRLSLRVAQLDGRVTLSLPNSTRIGIAESFLNEKADWIRKHLSNSVRVKKPSFGDMFPVAGEMLCLTPAKVRSVRIEGENLLLPENPEVLPARLRAFLKARARDRLSAACNFYSNRLGLPFSKITMRDTRSRWGSCTTDGNLMFSWRLAMAPRDVLDYVAAHEVAHLKEMNHSANYWAVVDRIHPNYEPPRLWLRVNGNSLHQWQL